MKISGKSIWMIITSFLVSAALIVTITIYALTVNKQGAIESAEMWFIIGMVILAALTFGLFAWYRLHKGKYVKRLNPQYYIAYEKLGDALQSAKMSKAEVKESKQDILALMLEAQCNDREVSEVVGEDMQTFADKVHSSYGYRSSFLFELCSVLQYGVFFVTFIQVLVYFSELGRVPFFESALGLSLAVMFVPIIFVMYPLLRRAMRKDKTTLAMLTPIVYGVAFIVLIILLDSTLGHLEWVRYFLDTQIVMISSLWQLVAMAAVLGLAQAVKWYLRRRSLKML